MHQKGLNSQKVHPNFQVNRSVSSFSTSVQLRDLIYECEPSDLSNLVIFPSFWRKTQF